MTFFNCIDHVASNSKTIKHEELKNLRKPEITIYFKVSLPHELGKATYYLMT
jgi:Cu/Ag efflux protein CusF